jgi:polyhydroxyalkanoate synthesis repressor PhaR
MSDESATSGNPKKLLLRKYPNRRYYDMSRSRYVTLEEIFDLIQAGYEIEVTDSKTGQDITARVLTQIMLDLDPPKLCAFSVPLLHRLIRANEQLVTDFVERYLNQMMSAFLDSQKAFEQSIRQTMGLSGAQPTVPPWMQMWNPMMQNAPTPWGVSRNGGAKASPPPPAGEVEPEAPPEPAATTAQHAGTNPADSQATRSELEELRKQLEALRAKLPKQPGSKRPGRPRQSGQPKGKG